jgi:hypothetical protein
VDCSRENGNDAGQKIQACLDHLPSGGIADARGLTGTQTVAHTITLVKPGTVLLLGSSTTLTLADGVTIDLVGSNVRVEGTGTTSVIRLGNQSSIRVGSPGHPLWGWHVEKLTVNPSPGKLPIAGLMLNNARQGIIREVWISGIHGSAVDVAENCWSDRAIDSIVTENDIGYNFHGDALNAWNIRGGLINTNRIGLNFDLGSGRLQGFSISDGTQMEANKDAGIRLVSGTILGLFLSEIYSEIFESQRLIKTQQSASQLHVGQLSITNGYIYSKDTPPLYLGSRPQDTVNASISSVILYHSQRKMQIVEASGVNTSVTVSESESESSVYADTSTEQLAVSRDGARTSTMHGGIPAK